MFSSKLVGRFYCARVFVLLGDIKRHTRLYHFHHLNHPLLQSSLITTFNVWCRVSLLLLLLAGGRSAHPAAAGAESAAGGAEPEEVLSRGNPAEEQQTAHPAARHCAVSRHTCARRHQLPADLHLQICHVCTCDGQHASFLPLRHSSHLERQAEEGQEQPPAGSGRRRRARRGG